MVIKVVLIHKIFRRILVTMDLGSGKLNKWAETIKLCWVSLSGTSATEARNIFLQNLRAWKYYGFTTFSVEQRKKPKKVLLVFATEGLIILNGQSTTKEVMNFYPWETIYGWRTEVGKSWHVTAGSLAKPIKLNFFHPHVIS